MNEDLVAQALARARDAGPAQRPTARLPSLAEEPAQPGDVLIHPAITGLPVEWLVVERAVVPLDPGSLVGSGDVALRETEGISRRTARCRHEQPSFPAALLGARRSGRLLASSLARVERRRGELAAGREGSYTETETDQDPEYADWLAEVIEPACRAWHQLGSAKVTHQQTTETQPRTRRVEGWLAWAAGILAIVGLGALGGLFWMGSRLGEARRTIAEQKAVAAQQESEHAAREHRLSEQLAASQEEARQAAETAREQLAAADLALDRAQSAALVVNPVLATLQPPSIGQGSHVRGESKDLVIPSHSSHLVLFLPVDQVVGGTLRLEIVDAEGRLLWSRDPIARQKGHEISVGVPAALLPSGELILRLYRRERGKEDLIREHHLRVAREKTPSRSEGAWP